MAKATPETAKIVLASEVSIGDEIYVEERWYGNALGMGDRWRTVVDIKPPEHDEGSFTLLPEILAGESAHLVQWVRPGTLIIVRKT